MRIKRLLSCVLLVLLFALAPAVKVMASTQDFYFKDFTADYYLTKLEDGTSKLHVKEVLTAVFPETNQNHGINRTIPIYNQDGHNQTVVDEGALNLKVLRNGQPEGINKILLEDDYYNVYIGDASVYVHGEQVYTLEYDFMNVITEFDGKGNNVSGQENVVKAIQELYWDTNGTAWSQKFNKLTARVHMPQDILAGVKDDTWCYVGKYKISDKERCTTERIEDGFSFTTGELVAKENLTFVIEFEPDTFNVNLPRIITRENYILVIVLVIEIAIITFVLVKKYRKWAREAKENSQLYDATFVAPQYQPPEDRTVHVAEGEQAFMGKAKSSYVATLLELAVTKAVTIKKIQNEKRPKKNDWSVHVNVEPSTLSQAQLSMLKILANSGSIAKDDDIDIKKHTATRTLANYAKDYKKDAEKALCKANYFIENRTSKVDGGVVSVIITKLITYVVFMMVGIAVFGDFLTGLLSSGPATVIVGVGYLPIIMVVLFIGAVIAGTILSNKTDKYSRYTTEGINLARYLDGLELYIKMAEKDRIEFLQSVKGADTSDAGIVKLYEKLLPWASLFGVEESWIKELNKYYQIADVPETISPDIMDGIIASNMLRNVNNVVASSTTYHEPSSGGGGSSFSSGGGGGGFSGGGGGGGGGGGW